MPVAPSSHDESSKETSFHPEPGLEYPLKYFQVSPTFMIVTVWVERGSVVVAEANRDWYDSFPAASKAETVYVYVVEALRPVSPDRLCLQ